MADAGRSRENPSRGHSLSLFGLHDVNLEIYSERFAGQMESVFERDKTNAREMTLEGWENRPLYVRLVEGALAPETVRLMPAEVHEGGKAMRITRTSGIRVGSRVGKP